MKKFFFLVACASLMVMGAKAQTAEELFKAGKAQFDRYDKLIGEYFIAQQQNPDAADPTAAERATLLIGGYEQLQKALALDTVFEVNKDGTPKIDKKTGAQKFKTKFSKDIVPMLTGHVNDIINVGNTYIQANDYAAALKAFRFYNTVMNSPIGAKVQAKPETLSEVAFFEGYSAYQVKDYIGAFTAFANAMKLGYTDNQVADFRNSSLANVIQEFCDAKKFDEATACIDNVLAAYPNVGLYHDMKGYIVEQKDGILAAESFYKAATQVDPTFGNGFFDLGRVIYEKAEKVIEANPTATNADLKPKLVPLYNEALPLFKKAQELDTQNSNTQIKRFIDDIEYKLELLGASK